MERGLFRAWVFISILWIIAVGAMAYLTIPDEVRLGRWQYLQRLKEGRTISEIDWNRYYESFRSPSEEKADVQFDPVEYYYQESLDKDVEEGHMKRIKVGNESIVYLRPQLTNEDFEYVIDAFWHQRWWRYFKASQYWALGILVPPIGLFVLGWALLWVGRGFKTAK